MGDEGALREIETRLDPLFARKDLWTLGAAESAGSRRGFSASRRERI